MQLVSAHPRRDPGRAEPEAQADPSFCFARGPWRSWGAVQLGREGLGWLPGTSPGPAVNVLRTEAGSLASGWVQTVASVWAGEWSGPVGGCRGRRLGQAAWGVLGPD